MYKRDKFSFAIVVGCSLLAFLFLSCSNKKNTAASRLYHSVNTRYNVHFNANEAYKESLKRKEDQEEERDNLSQLLHISPLIEDSTDLKYKGTFTTTIDKTTKAIKLHSISTRPRRDPGKKMDEQYREWLRQKEFNPFLVNTWMLLGKAEFEEGNYLRAITTFMYISKIYETDKKIVSECKLWIAQAYSEMGWMYEAEDVLRKMEQNNEIHHQLTGMYASAKANLYVRNGNYESAIPYLEEAISKEKKGNAKRRKKYLLGQLYAITGDKEKAYKAFGDVRGLITPYNYVINSKLRQLEVSNQSESRTISALNKLTKGVKNEEYLDQVYTMMGNVYINNMDTLKAIESYAKAIEKSKRQGYDKALAQIKLGALYFDRRDYVKAQPCYAGALPLLKKSNEYYPIVALRSEVLDQLVVYAKVVQEQDSLLLLADMPENERLEVINKHIEKLKKEEKEKKRQEHREQTETDRVVSGWGDLEGWDSPQALQPSAQTQQQGSDFYFYNEQIVNQGKISYQRQWGRRPLEDDWRRKSKETSSPFGEEELLAQEEEQPEKQTEKQEGEQPKSVDEAATEKMATDIYSVEYYLQQLPMTPEAKQAAYKLIENGLFNMGLIYKNLLEDRKLAIETFDVTLNRFPETAHREEIYYQLFLIYLQMGNQEMAEMYRDRIIDEYPESKYAVPLKDPNYAWNFTYMSKMQEELYDKTYEAYLAGDVQTVRNNYSEIQTKFPFVDLMPKFAFLNSLSYAQTKDAPNLEKNLTKLIADYPQSDVVPLATSILKNIKDGKILLSDGSPIIGMDWTMAYANDSIFEGEGSRALEYLTDIDKPYTLLLMFEPKSIDRNELLFEVADYNFSNYVIQTYDLSFNTDEISSYLEISGFDDFKSIKSYLNKAMLEEGLLTRIDKKIIPIPISRPNYTDVFPRLGLEQYIAFYTDSLAMETPRLLAYWDRDGSEEVLTAMLEESLAVKEEPSIIIAEEEKKPDSEQPIVPETSGEKVTFPVTGTEPKKEEKEDREQHNDKEVNLDDVLSKEQVAAIGAIDKKTDDIAAAISNLGSNPVEGLKNIFNRNKIEDNLTKEEKAELKREQKEERERQKEVNRIEKARTDSVARVEKLRLDSIATVEKAREDSMRLEEQQAKEKLASERKEAERLKKEQEDARKKDAKDKEEARKQQLREREDRRKQQEKERQEKQHQKEQERNEMMKKREEERKAKAKEMESQRKQRGR